MGRLFPNTSGPAILGHPEVSVALLPENSIQAAFEEVQAHARRHAVDALLFRVRVGQALVRHLYGGDFGAMHEAMAAKDSLFSTFVRRHGGELSAIGLRPDTLRRCLAAAEAADGLEEEDFRELGFMRLAALSGVEDPAWRRALMTEALRQDWTAAELRAAIRHADVGLLTDADPDRAGTQPLVVNPEPREPDPRPPRQRPEALVSRLRGTAGAVEELAVWLGKQRSRPFSSRQRDEAWRQVESMEARLLTIKAMLPPRREDVGQRPP